MGGRTGYHRRGVAVRFSCVPFSDHSTYTVVGAFGFGGEREGEWRGNDELCLPDTAALQSAANAVLESASNNCENVGEKREVVGDDEEGEGECEGEMDTISLRDYSGQTLLPFGTGADSNDSNTPVFELPHGRRRARPETTTWGREQEERWKRRRGTHGWAGQKDGET